ncbi:hypothetical protein ACFVAG_33740, partial [Streptomyces sp. NPDC057644]
AAQGAAPLLLVARRTPTRTTAPTASAHAAACAVLVAPSPPPVDPARGTTFARSLEEADPGVLSDCLRRPEASGS